MTAPNESGSAAPGTHGEPQPPVGSAGSPALDADTRDRLVRAAIEVFLEKGYGGTRVQDVANLAGVTSGAVYVHFPSRTALLAEAILREGHGIVARLASSVAQITPGGGRAARALAELSTAESSRFDRLLLEAFALAARSPEAAEVLSSSMNVFLDGLFEQVSAAVESGVIDPSLSRDALRHLFARWMFGAIVSRTLGVNRVPIDDMNVLYARVADALRPS